MRQPGVLYSFKNPKSYYTNNVKATKTLCYICKNIKLINLYLVHPTLFTGIKKKISNNRKFIPNPKNPYAKTKLQSEKLVKRIFKNSKISYLIFRFFTVYGPFGRPDIYS